MTKNDIAALSTSVWNGGPCKFAIIKGVNRGSQKGWSLGKALLCVLMQWLSLAKVHHRGSYLK